MDRRARRSGARAHRDLEPPGPLQPGLRVWHRGHARPDAAGALRVCPPPDPHGRRALRHGGAQGVRGKVLGADERRRRLEHELFAEVRRQVAVRAAELLATARALARLDVLAGARGGGARARPRASPRGPRATHSRSSRVATPYSRARAGTPVTPNDLALDREARIVILTGPNMAGKSVYLRQTAHIAILAQMGAFVPAREARLGVLDRVFTRVGAQDNLARGQSTFLVEMVETANDPQQRDSAEPRPPRRGRAGDFHL